MADLLYCHAIGRVGKAPEMTTSPKTGNKFVKFQLGVNQMIKGNRVPTWISVAVFDPGLFSVASSLTVGTTVHVAGNIVIATKGEKLWLDLIAHSISVLRNGRPEVKPEAEVKEGEFGDETPF